MLNACKYFRKEPIVFLTGAGTSIAYGTPTTEALTNRIADNFVRSAPTTMCVDLYERICCNLQGYLVRPSIVTFEDIYQGVLDVYATLTATRDPRAFDEFRPRLLASHELVPNLKNFTELDVRLLQTSYLRAILQTFIDLQVDYDDYSEPEGMIRRIKRSNIIWSFTLNYDPYLGNSIGSCVSGFSSGPAPRRFDQKMLMSAIERKRDIHCYLHGSLRWGWGDPATNPFELYEYDTISEAFNHVQSNRSSRPDQSGRPIVPSSIITGLGKLESVFNEPFLSIVLALMSALQNANKLVIAGYSFSDRHINQAVSKWRENNPHRALYIVDYDYYNDVNHYFDHENKVNVWHIIYPGDPMMARDVPGYDGWQVLPGEKRGGYNTGPVYLWLGGFDTYCRSVISLGLPQL